MKTSGLIISLFLCFLCPNSWTHAKNIRIISLAPATTEILFALGLDEDIVAVSQFCDYPKAALTKEKAGTFSTPDIERIIYLKPDIIFCTGLEQAETVHKLRQLGFNVYVSDPKNFEELFSSISAIAGYTHKETAGQMLIAEMKKRIESVRARAACKVYERKQKVFIEIWHDPLITAGRTSFLDELITLAGGENIAGTISRPYGIVSPEFVITKNPDCIILAYMRPVQACETIRNRLGWQKVSAVSTNRIYGDIDPNILLRCGPRAVEALEDICKRLYPDEISSKN